MVAENLCKQKAEIKSWAAALKQVAFYTMIVIIE